jgi:PAS domain S-box-containing protein
MKLEDASIRGLTAAFLEAQGGRIAAELSERLGQAGSASLLPVHRALLDLVTGHIRDASPSRLVAEVRRRASEFRGDIQAVISGQTVLWVVLHRLLREVEGPHRTKDSIYSVLSLAGDALDGVAGALIDISLSGGATVSPEGWRTLVELGRTHREDQMLNRAIGDLLDARELGQMFDILERVIIDTFHLRSLVIVAVNHEKGIVEMVRAHSDFPQNPAHRNLRVDLSHPDILSDVARTGRTEVIDGWDPRYYEWTVRPDGSFTSVQKPKDFNAGQTAFFVPILTRGRVIGIVCTGSPQENKPFVLREIERMRPFLDQVGAALSVVSEVAERRRAEGALQESEARLNLALDAARMGVWDSDLLTGRLIWSESMEALFGLAPGAFAGTRDAFYELVHPEDREAVRRAVGRAVEAGVDFEVEHRIVRPDGAVRWMASKGQVFRDASGRAVHMLGAVQDITERKRAEEVLRETEERFRDLFDNAPVGYHELDTEGRVLRVNRTECDMLGYRAEEMVGRSIWDFVVDQEAARRLFRSGLEGRALPGQPFERMYRRKDGTVFPVLIEARWLRDATGRVTGVRATLQDITERKRMGEERARLGRAVEQAAESIMITDPDGTIIYVNPAFEWVTGYSREEAVGQNPRILRSGRQDTAFYREMWNTLTRGEVWTGRFINRRKDGTLFEEEAIISPVRDAAGKVVNYVAAKRDVTQEVALEAQLRQAQKMEAIGTLAGGVAHDFNNLLTTIIGFAQLALMEEDLSPGVRDCISKIPEQGRRAAQLISQLLTFSRKAVTEKQPMTLAPLVKETVKMLERTLPEHVAIRLNIPDGVAIVNADPTQMQQVIMNLCVNASHAMPNGGELTVGLENVTLDEAYCRKRAYARPGRHVCLFVRDTGVGMTPEVQARIFEPFFTTKGVGEGTGLGLAVVYGTVKGHEGHINVYSEVGKGSEFKVYIPTMEVAETPPRGVSKEEPPAQGTETVLLVEDDARVLAVGQAMLKRLGYTVLTASNGEDGLRVYRECQGEIALVVTDMVMPGMGGEEFYDALRQTDAGVKVVLMSGYSMKQDLSDLRTRGLRGFVQKPLDFYALGHAVRRALDE